MVITTNDVPLPAGMTIIDAHHHFWLVDDEHCAAWLPFAPAQLQQDFLPSDLAKTSGPCGISCTILVQAAQTRDETEWLLHVAAASSMVRGVVGWVDPADAESVPTLERWCERGLVGVRLWNQDDPDCAILDSYVDAPLLIWAAQRDLPLDLLLRPQHLPGAIRLVRAHPEVRFIIDHAAKPNIAAWQPGDAAFGDWSGAMATLAQMDNVMCKLSGLVTEAAEHWSLMDLQPYADVLFTSFGPQRLVWGSDWPVLLKAGAYASWLDTAVALTAALSIDERELIFGRNAETFYRI